MNIETYCVHSRTNKTDNSGALTVPIYQTATYAHPALGQSTGFDYVRGANPTRDALEETMCKLEHAEAALAFASGMAAIAAVMETFQAGDHIIVSDDLYGGSWRLFEKISKKNGLAFTWVDACNLDEVAHAFTPATKAVYIETPSNPLMKVIDIAETAKLAHEHNALLIVDNTFLTPILQQPLTLGADIVVHSATKFLAGHNDTLAGIVACKSKEIAEKVAFVRLTTGAPLSPFDSFLVIRGIKTLALRVKRQSESAFKIAKWLQTVPCVKKVYYPGLAEGKERAITDQQSHGFGGMISFEVYPEADTQAQISRILEKVKIIQFAESLGGTETLITYPTTQTHAAIDPEIRVARGITDTLLRLSIGIEDADDLIEDLAQALDVPPQKGPSFDFDTVIDRHETGSLKYDFAAERQKPVDALPMWVADMDFRCPEVVTQALNKMTAHNIYGYTEPLDGYFEAVTNWFSKRHNWQTKREWIVLTPGVVFAICAAIRAFTKEGDAVLIQPPVYYPFHESIAENKRTLVENPLVLKDGHYVIDFKDFEQKIIQNNVKLFILCNPHNPVGRVWHKDELQKMAEICVHHNVFIIADEIHADFALTHAYTPFGTLGEQLTQNAIICTSASKTFNLAGLQVSNIFIPNATHKAQLKAQINAVGYSQLNTAGIVATGAAYAGGEAWLEALHAYLKDNLAYLKDFLARNLPQIKLMPLEGTYLPWLDFKETGLSGKALDEFLLNKARLWLDAGYIFGTGGENFARINIACPRSVLKQALTQLQAACMK